jgi:hypothetical protein
MIKQNHIRKNDFIVVYNKEDQTEEDYYMYNGNDFKWLLDNSIYLFDNFYISNLIENWEFSVAYKEEDKKKILEKIK